MPKRPVGTVSLNVWLPPGLKEELIALAAADQRNLSSYVRVALMAHVARTCKTKHSTMPPAGDAQDVALPAGGHHG